MMKTTQDEVRYYCKVMGFYYSEDVKKYLLDGCDEGCILSKKCPTYEILEDKLIGTHMKQVRPGLWVSTLPIEQLGEEMERKIRAAKERSLGEVEEEAEK